MASLKDSFTKGLTAINVKTNTFMEESKCKTYISTLEGEIKDLKLLAGEKSYEAWSKGESTTQGIEELFVQIKDKYQEIAAQEEKIEQLAQEEKQIFGTQNAASREHENADVVYCSQCGAQNAGNYKFCCKCGVTLVK